MTTIVPTSEEDPFLAVVRFTSQLAWADAGPEVPSYLDCEFIIGGRTGMSNLSGDV